MIINISLCEIIVKNEFHVANNCQFFDKFLVKLRLNVEFVAGGEDDDRRVEFFDLDVDEFFHYELYEL